MHRAPLAKSSLSSPRTPAGGDSASDGGLPPLSDDTVAALRSAFISHDRERSGLVSAWRLSSMLTESGVPVTHNHILVTCAGKANRAYKLSLEAVLHLAEEGELPDGTDGLTDAFAAFDSSGKAVTREQLTTVLDGLGRGLSEDDKKNMLREVVAANTMRDGRVSVAALARLATGEGAGAE